MITPPLLLYYGRSCFNENFRGKNTDIQNNASLGVYIIVSKYFPLVSVTGFKIRSFITLTSEYILLLVQTRVFIIIHTTLFPFVLFICTLCHISVYSGARGSVVVKALCYKPEGRGFDSR
jgi:hypothetical protein